MLLKMRKFIILLAVGAVCSIKLLAQSSITVDDAGKHVGESVSVCGKVVGAKAGDRKSATQVNIGGGFSNTRVILTISPNDRKNFAYKPEAYLINKDVCVTGTLTNSSGRVEMVVTKDDQIQVREIEEADEYLPFNPLSKYFDWE
ncbi:MAG: hypothetical protein JWQ96_2198 [Segetibacter sp.]|nr:hypothetical protein [Segetibacter sp.]